jgi:hypothetical protein
MFDRGSAVSPGKIHKIETTGVSADTCAKYNVTEFLRTYKDYGTDGVFDVMYQRIQFHFASIKRKEGNSCIYIITGFDRLKGLVTPFQGEISIGSIYKNKGNFYESDIPGDDKLIEFSASFIFKEDGSVKGSGVFQGKLYFSVHLNKQGQLSDDLGEYMGDGFYNFVYDGNWTSYKTGKVKRCIWGQGRLFGTGDWDVGDGDRVVNEKYRQYGWEYKDGQLVDNPKEWWKTGK